MDSNTEENTINLDLGEALQNENIVTHLVANKKTKCLEVKLNHAYANKNVVSKVYPDWIKTLNAFSIRDETKKCLKNM